MLSSPGYKGIYEHQNENVFAISSVDISLLKHKSPFLIHLSTWVSNNQYAFDWQGKYFFLQNTINC